MSNITRWGGPAAIAAGLLWMAAFTYMALDELEYAGEIADNPIPSTVGMPALMLAALTTIFALTALRAVAGGGKAGTGVGFGIAYLGAAVSLVPMWPAIFLGPLLLMVGLTVLGWVVPARRPSASPGHRLHALGLPVVAVVAPLLDLAGVIDGGKAVLVAAALLSAGLIWIGLDLNKIDREITVGAGVAA